MTRRPPPQRPANDNGELLDDPQELFAELAAKRIASYGKPVRSTPKLVPDPDPARAERYRRLRRGES